MSAFCFGNSVQQGAKHIAIFQMVTAAAISVLISGPIILDSIQYSHISASDTFFTVLLVLIAGSIQFFIGYILYSGAVQLRVPQLNSWLVFSAFELILATFKLWIGITSGNNFDSSVFVFQMVSLVIEFWFIGVVYELRSQIVEKKLCVAVYSQPKSQKEIELETV